MKHFTFLQLSLGQVKALTNSLSVATDEFAQINSTA